MAEKLWIEMMFLLGPNEIFGFMMFFDNFQPTEPVQNKKMGLWQLAAAAIKGPGPLELIAGWRVAP